VLPIWGALLPAVRSRANGIVYARGDAKEEKWDENAKSRDPGDRMEVAIGSNDESERACQNDKRKAGDAGHRRSLLRTVIVSHAVASAERAGTETKQEEVKERDGG